jgi:hypothetical protein
MELHQWLDQPENAGKAAWLADQLARSKTAVSLWRTEGVPMPLMQRVSDLTDGAVTVEAMLMHALTCKTAKPAPEAA